MTPERDLTAERDGRVMPFIRNFLFSLGKFPFVFQEDPENAEEAAAEAKSHADFYEQEFIPQALARNLMLTDLNYTFQQAKNVIEMLRARAHVPGDGSRERTIPAARAILVALSQEETLMLTPVLNAQGQESNEDGIARAALYDKIYQEKVRPILDEHKVAFHEVEEVFAIMTVLITTTAENTDRTVNQAVHYAESKLWGIDDRDNLTLNMVHKKCIEDKTE